MLKAQQQYIKVAIFDSLTKEPLENVVIKQLPSGTLNQSGINGFSDISNKTSAIILSCVGYCDRLIKIQNDSLILIGMSRSSRQLKDIVVKNETRLSTYRILSTIDLNLQPVKSAQDLLRLVPGLFIAQHMGGGKAEQIFLRGFDADHGTDVNITVDGMPVNMVTHAHGQGYADLHFLIPETVSSYDFGKGPYYADKGDFTTAGFVAYKTKQSLTENSIKLEAGRYNTYRLMGMFNIFNTLNKPNGQSLYIAGENLYSDGGPFELPEHFKRFNLFGKFVKKFGDNNTFTTSISTFHSKWRSGGEIPDRALDEGYVNSRFGFIDSGQGGLTNRSNLILKVVSNLHNNWQLENQAYLTRYDFSLVSNFTFFNYFPDTGDEFRQREKRTLAGYNLKLSRTTDLNSIIVSTDAGIGLRHDHISPLEMDHTRGGKFIGLFSLDKASELNINGWLNGTFQYKRWVLNTGLRFDYFHFRSQNLVAINNKISQQVDKEIICPKINLTYNFSSQLQLYAKAGKGFHSNDARIVIPNSNLSVLPAAYGIDIGINWKPVDKIFINAAAWYLYLKQEFVFGQDLSDQLDGPVSPSGRTVRTGIDCSIRYQITSWLFASLNANVAHPRYIDSLKDHNYIELAPTFTSTAAIDFHLKNGLYGGISYRYLHDRPGNTDNTLTARGYFITDLTVNYRHKYYELGLSVENLFNSVWDESQIAYTTRLKNETVPVEQISYTPGVPFYPKFKLTVFF